MITLPASGTVQNIRSLHAAMLQELTADGPITLDAAAVEQADLSLLQLIQALRMTAADAGRPVRLCTPAPAPVAGLLERAGFLAVPTADDLDFWFHGVRPQ